MSPETERIRAVLLGLEGRARAMPLVDLGERLWADYVRTGVGSTAAHPFLTEIVEAMEEARCHFEPDDPVRHRATVLLGIGQCLSFAFHDGATADADSGTALLEAELDGAATLSGLSAVARVAVSFAALRRVQFVLQEPDRLAALLGHGTPTDLAEHLDRADSRLSELSAARSQAQLAAGAAGMRTAVGALRRLLAVLGSPDPTTPAEMMPELTRILKDLKQIDLVGIRLGDVRVEDTEWTTDPRIPWPVELFQGEPETRPHVAHVRPVLAVDVDVLRRNVRYLIGAGRDPHVDDDPYATAVGFLQAEEPPAWVDRFVAAAAAVVHSAEAPSGLDRFLLAVALHLRGRWDDGGWDGVEKDAPGGTPDGDVQASVRHLLAAAEDIVSEDPDGVPALVYTATLSPEGTLAELGSRLAPLSEDLRAVGASALRFAEPVRGLWWNAVEGRFEASGGWMPAGSAVLLDGTDEISQNPAKPSVSDQADDGLEIRVAHVASLSQLRSLAHREPHTPGNRPSSS
ncbi:hypothetical protein Caci_6949 [Catenulispora acidiphila DSM 44928]|uniref:Uncharacterized protein n=1 Tax=Catenulispora acidiphila (strain DSM 44928 / JCM 14897 / NBRC 102108 / NRRL B-24433 / ID139908) TaxID=479433 RepID=C7Q3L5_CATAD|nr:hypothetical protein [Catenulispora acidiphila]ACU75780.1 hypothetical protein Caci_6949 [Catenulispora acidiphila DSM 44928]